MTKRKTSLQKTKRRALNQKQTSPKIQNSGKKTYRTYKDRGFRILFKEKIRLLELYNALNDALMRIQGTEKVVTKDVWNLRSER